MGLDCARTAAVGVRHTSSSSNLMIFTAYLLRKAKANRISDCNTRESRALLPGFRDPGLCRAGGCRVIVVTAYMYQVINIDLAITIDVSLSSGIRAKSCSHCR